MNFEMIEKRCLKKSAPYSKLAGVWPGQDFHIKYIANSILYPIMLFSVITQMSRIIIYWSVDTLLEQLQYLCVPLGMYVKHICFAMNQSKFTALFESILDDWAGERTADEQKIMDRFADRARLFIAVYMANAYFVGIAFFFVPFMPILLDVIMPLNETRPKVHMYEAHYFIKHQENYYYEIMIYTVLSLMVAVLTFISVDTLLIYLVQHSCGLLNLAGHRVRYGLDKWGSMCDTTPKDHRKMYDSVVYAIQTHERALTFLTDLDNIFRLSLFLQIGLIVATLTVTLLRAASVKLTADTYQFYAYAVAQLVHLLFLTAQGQLVINEHDTIYEKGFEMNWYNADVRTQTLLVLIQRRNLNPPQLTAAGLIRLDLDSFSEVVKASVSYFTVLKSV